MEKTFMTIREIAKAGILSEHYLRRREAQGILPGVYSGKKKLVNVPALMEQLDRESREAIAPNCHID